MGANALGLSHQSVEDNVLLPLVKYEVQAPDLWRRLEFTVDAPVSLRDVAATILDLAKPATAQATLPGIPLASSQPTSPVFSYAHQGINVDPSLPNANGPVLSLVLDSLHYIRDGNQAEVLFDLKHDSSEARDVSRSPAFAGPLRQARRMVDSLRSGGIGAR